MEENTTKMSEKTAKALDDFIMTYYDDGLTEDFRQLTPAQRVGIFIKCVALRLPKFKAIELNSNTGLTRGEFDELIGAYFRPIRETGDPTREGGGSIPEAKIVGADSSAVIS